MSVKFSVVMTVFDTYHFLPRAIGCLMDQIHQNWELLLVADGAAPRSRYAPRKILRPLQKTFPRNRVEFFEIPRAEGRWGNVARAYGLKQAQGDYICWVNHDNLIAPDYLRTHLCNIRQRAGCLSVVDIHLWKDDRYFGRYPRGYRCNKIDLLCFSVPIQTARDVEAFGPDVEGIYAADGMLFEACARLLPIEHQHRAVGIHF